MKYLFGFAAMVVSAAAIVYMYDRYEAYRLQEAAKIEHTQKLIGEALQQICKKFGPEYSYRRSDGWCCSPANHCMSSD